MAFGDGQEDFVDFLGSRVVKFKLRRISCAGRVVRDETADIGRGQVENPDSLKMCGGG